MKTLNLLLFGFSFCLLYGCLEVKNEKILIVKNPLNIARTFETVELQKEFLGIEDLVLVGIKDVETGELLITQTVDSDGDGNMDELLFQPKIEPNSEKEYKIVTLTNEEQPKSIDFCYSRFVPERTDDYTWENNKVAFRVYGPNAQYRAENNLKEPTLSSGVDAWLKKVDYPIINKWYKKYTEKAGSYHEDTGEGLDNFHVGKSRGVGGIAVKQDSIFYYSKNFTKWRTITTGPIRTSFYLEYANWDAGGNQIKESKIISLDYGNNLSKFETKIEGSTNISAGLTLHEKDGEVNTNKENYWISYWQPHANSELGSAIITYKNYLKGFENYKTEVRDESNAYAHLNVINNSVTYYSGFGWKESGQFTTKKQWEDYLNSFSLKINNPLLVELLD